MRIAEYDEVSVCGVYSDAVSALQEGALSVLKEYKQATRELVLPMDMRFATAPFVRLLTRPTANEAVAWGNLPFWPDFGKQSRDHFIARPGRSLLAYLFRPCRLKSDYRKCFWRAGFYRRLPWAHRLLLRLTFPRLKFAYKAS